MTTRLRHYKRVALIGVTTAALALFSLAAWASTLSYFGLEAFLMVIGAGIGLVIADVFLLLMEEKTLRSGRAE
jgi:hypothetical protein